LLTVFFYGVGVGLTFPLHPQPIFLPMPRALMPMPNPGITYEESIPWDFAHDTISSCMDVLWVFRCWDVIFFNDSGLYFTLSAASSFMIAVSWSDVIFPSFTS